MFDIWAGDQKHWVVCLIGIFSIIFSFAPLINMQAYKSNIQNLINKIKKAII